MPRRIALITSLILFLSGVAPLPPKQAFAKDATVPIGTTYYLPRIELTIKRSDTIDTPTEGPRRGVVYQIHYSGHRDFKIYTHPANHGNGCSGQAPDSDVVCGTLPNAEAAMSAWFARTFGVTTLWPQKVILDRLSSQDSKMGELRTFLRTDTKALRTEVKDAVVAALNKLPQQLLTDDSTEKIADEVASRLQSSLQDQLATWRVQVRQETLSAVEDRITALEREIHPKP